MVNYSARWKDDKLPETEMVLSKHRGQVALGAPMYKLKVVEYVASHQDESSDTSGEETSDDQGISPIRS